MDSASAEQQKYYAQRAESYGAHLQPGDEHYIALEYSLGLLAVLRAETVLDVGAGTGRAVEFLRTRGSDLSVQGLEPVESMRRTAAERGIELLAGNGQSLPFADASVDVVIATGVLHHLANPAPVVAEMLRVARRGVLISDANRYGQGRPTTRVLKLALQSAGLWPLFERVRTHGRGYMRSEGDGIFYSYSVYDSLTQVDLWADRVFVIPTLPGRARRSFPILQSGHGLLVGVRESEISGWASPTPMI